MRQARGWTCRRVSESIICAHHNKPRTRRCARCGKPRPPRRRPAHMTVLATMDYAAYVALNGGERCGICGRAPSPRRRLDRDHQHTGTGVARGLLCHSCNRRLSIYMTIEWLEKALAYLKRAEQRSAVR